jgi:predicted CXXCH cytochrome family protein
MGYRTTYTGLLMLIAVGVLVSACSPQAGKRMITFFFDGVPAADSSRVEVPDEAALLADSSISGEPAPGRQMASVVVHYPYGERECDICHNPDALGTMVEPEPGLCYLCHEDFNDSYAWVHGPAAGGYCTSCHDPHTSQEEKLLRMTGPSLCFYCHLEPDVLKNEMHADLDGMACTDCHNPHGGEDHLILY